MSTQSTNYTLPFSAVAGMQKAIDHADPRWKEMAKCCVVIEARSNPEITVDNVWSRMDAVNDQRKRDGLPLFETHNKGAIGPVMLMCSDDTHQFIRATGRYQRSRIAHKHGNLSQVWTSLLYSGGAQ